MLPNRVGQSQCHESISCTAFFQEKHIYGFFLIFVPLIRNIGHQLAIYNPVINAYVITPGGQQINYVCVDAFNGHNDVTGYDALQKDDGTVVWGSAELIVYTCLGDAYNVRVACFNRA